MLILWPDNTNADPETRAVWIKLAQKLGVPIRCVLFTASAKICEHNDTVRALNMGPEVSFPTLNASRIYLRQLLPHRGTRDDISRYPNEEVATAEN